MVVNTNPFSRADVCGEEMNLIVDDLIVEDTHGDKFFDCHEVEKSINDLRNRVAVLEKMVGTDEELCTLIRHIVLSDEDISQKLYRRFLNVGQSNRLSNPSKPVSKVGFCQVKEVSSRNSIVNKPQKSKRTVFPFKIGQKHPSGFVHEFFYQQSVYLIDEKCVVTVVDETPCYTRILDEHNPTARLKLKSNLSPFRK